MPENSTPNQDLPKIGYVAERDVDAALDAELRQLLSACFTGTRNAFFNDRRYYKESPQHRWFIRDAQGTLAAHVALHEKHILHQDSSLRFGGIAEVCVRPDCRGRGYVGQLLREVHHWLTAENIPFAILFGNPKVYTSSGYFPVENLYRDVETDGRTERLRASGAMVSGLSPQPWPTEDVFLPGPIF